MAYSLFIAIFIGGFLGAWLFDKIRPPVIGQALTIENVVNYLLATFLICLFALAAEIMLELFLFQPATFLYKLFKKN